jgi:hypothetical protein
MNKKSILLTSLMMLTSGLSYGAVATVQELRNEEQALYDKLVEHWIDKEGSTHLGNKELNPTAIQFSLSKNIINKQSIKQITDSMNTPLKKFTPEQQQDFKEAVKADLDDLAKVQDELKKLRNQMDDAATKLGQLLGKTRDGALRTKDDVLKLADRNLEELIKIIPDGAKKIDANIEFGIIKKLRPQFDIQTVAAPIVTARKGGSAESEEETGATGSTATQKPSKVAAAASVVAETKTKLSSIIKAASEAAIYAPCGDLHFDIIEDEEGIKFLRLIK